MEKQDDKGRICTDNVVVVFAGNERGGGATHLYAFAQSVVSAGVENEITFLSIGTGGLFDKIQAILSGTSVIEGRVTRVIEQLQKQMVEKGKSVLWHAHGPRVNLVVGVAARRAKVRYTSTIHSDPNKDFLGSRLKTLLFPKLNAWSLRRASGLFVGNRKFAELFPSLPSFYVPNAVEEQRREQRTDELRDALGIPAESTILGIAARFDPVKSIDTAIRAFALVSRASDHPVHLIIAGDGEEKEKLVHQVRENGVESVVHFVGFLDPIDSFFETIDLLILPSKSEGESPYVILEAGTYGVPTVGSDIPGIRNLIQDGLTGRTFPVGDVQALADVLSALISDESLRETYVRAFRETVLPKYTKAAMLQAYQFGYRQMTGSPLPEAH